MSTSRTPNQQFLNPPAITTLKEGSISERAPLSRAPSVDIRAERDDLKVAAEQSLNVILDLNLDGIIRWISPSWKSVVGTLPEDVRGKPIANLLLSNQDVFASAIESMKNRDSKSRIIHFSVTLGPHSVLRRELIDGLESAEAGKESQVGKEEEEQDQALNLKGQGIMVYDRSSGDESHV